MLIPFYYWADKAVQASLALLIQHSLTQTVGPFQMSHPHVDAAALGYQGW